LEVSLEPVIRAAELGKQFGAKVILNPAPAPAGPLPVELLARVDVLTPNQYEAQALAGMEADPTLIAQRMSVLGVQAMVMTLGAEGAWCCAGQEGEMIPGHRVEAVDTTAAGDCFSGALTVALSEGKPLGEAVHWANCAAAISVTRLGAQPSLPTRSEVEAAWRRMEERVGSGEG
jgi:ribokinase